MTPLRQALLAYDGKDTDTLLKVWTESGGNDLMLLAELVSDPRVSEGASWLLKAALEDHTDVDASLLCALADALPASNWVTALHICQIFAVHAPPAECADSTASELLALTEHARPFVRAWSVSAFHALAERTPNLRAQANALVERASADPAASVRARMRHLKAPG